MGYYWDRLFHRRPHDARRYYAPQQPRVRLHVFSFAEMFVYALAIAFLVAGFLVARAQTSSPPPASSSGTHFTGCADLKSCCPYQDRDVCPTGYDGCECFPYSGSPCFDYRTFCAYPKHYPPVTGEWSPWRGCSSCWDPLRRTRKLVRYGTWMAGTYVVTEQFRACERCEDVLYLARRSFNRYTLANRGEFYSVPVRIRAAGRDQRPFKACVQCNPRLVTSCKQLVTNDDYPTVITRDGARVERTGSPVFNRQCPRAVFEEIPIYVLQLNPRVGLLPLRVQQRSAQSAGEYRHRRSAEHENEEGDPGLLDRAPAHPSKTAVHTKTDNDDGTEQLTLDFTNNNQHLHDWD